MCARGCNNCNNQSRIGTACDQAKLATSLLNQADAIAVVNDFNSGIHFFLFYNNARQTVDDQSLRFAIALFDIFYV